MILKAIRNWREQRALKRHAIPDALWQLTLLRYPFLAQRNADDLTELRRLCSLFLSTKEFHGVDGFEVTRGEPVIGGMKAPELQHNFCPDCMTWLFTRLAGAPFVNVRPTMLDDATWFRPFIETWTSTRLPFAETGAVRSFGEFPAMEEIEGVLKDYAQWAASGGSG